MWTLETKLSGGHRLFNKADNDGVYIADESGATPDLTDDGPMWLDLSRHIKTDGQHVYVPVRKGDDDATSAPHVVSVALADALYLSARYAWTIATPHGGYLAQVI